MLNTTCEVKLQQPARAAAANLHPPAGDTNGSSGFLVVGTFNQFGVAEGTLGPDLGAIEAFRLSIGAASENWAILSEIFFKQS